MIWIDIAVVVLLATVLELVRRRRLREEFSWLWIGACALCLVAAHVPPLRDWLTASVPASSEVQLLLIGACLFLVALCLDFSIQVSSQSTHIKNLAQEVALLRKALDELQAKDDDH